MEEIMRVLILASMAAGLLFTSVVPSFVGINRLIAVAQAKTQVMNEEGQDIPTPPPQPEPHPPKKGKWFELVRECWLHSRLNFQCIMLKRRPSSHRALLSSMSNAARIMDKFFLFLWLHPSIRITGTGAQYCATSKYLKLCGLGTHILHTAAYLDLPGVGDWGAGLAASSSIQSIKRLQRYTTIKMKLEVWPRFMGYRFSGPSGWPAAGSVDTILS
jgi:hypothetical protein